MAKQRKRRLKPYEAVPFTNDLGHVINPGDGIIAVTKCTASVGVNVGRYLGLRRHKSNWGKKEEYVTVVVEYDKIEEYHAHKVTGERWPWNYEPPGLERPGHYPWQKFPERSSLPWYATPEQKRKAQDDYVAACEESAKKHQEELTAYQARAKVWSEAVEAHKAANYEEVKKPYVVVKTLQRNRIYPVNMQMKELVKK